MSDPESLVEPIRRLHDRIRDGVVEACAQQSAEDLSSVDAEESSDTIYVVDRVSESILIQGLEAVAEREPLVVMAEGLAGGALALPRGARDEDCRWRVLVDPIDGTREIMYQKRSAWVLTGVAPNRGHTTRLRDIVLAVQTEIPIVKQNQSDQWWAVRGHGAQGIRHDRSNGRDAAISAHPSRATTLAHGFASVSRFFPGVRAMLAAIDDDIAREVVGDAAPGKAALFEDQYLSTGGQLHELMCGHDRFIADIRPLLAGAARARGLDRGLCCHPYDLCSALVAEELGVQLALPDGSPLDAPFDLDYDCAWVGYANAQLRSLVEPALQNALRRRGLPLAT